MLGGWPLIGRSEQLALMSGLAARRGGPAGVVLAGAAGVGKTRLAREALAAAEGRGVVTRWAAATASARALPLGAFAATVGSVGPDSSQLIRQATARLSAGAGRGGVLIGVDDAHLLDELSAALLHQLVLRRAAMVVLTLRSGEPAPDAVTGLWKDGHLWRLEVPPLSMEETTALLEAVLGGPLDRAAARRLWAITRGNPLYLRQLVDGELEARRLREVAGVWRWSGQPRLTPGLIELIETRFGALGDAELAVVEVLAFGEPLGVPLVAGLTGGAALEAAEARGLVEVYPDGRRLQARLAHPLYGEVQRARCGQLRARRLRGRITQALADTGARRGDDTLRRAVLALDSDLAPDPELLTAGARRALQLVDFGLAERLLGAVDAAGFAFEPRLILGFVLSWSGRGDQAEAVLAELGALARTDAERVQATIPRVGNLFWTLARPAEAEAVLAAAAGVVSDPVARLELSAVRAVLDAFLARPVRAAEATAAVFANPLSSPQALTWAGWGLALAHGGLGRADGLDDIHQRIDALANSFGTGFLRISVGEAWLRALRLAGWLEQAEHEARRYLDAYQDALGPASAITGALFGLAALDRGRVRTAAWWISQASAGFRGADPGGVSFLLSLNAAKALGMAGLGGPAREVLKEMDAARHPACEFLAPDVLLAHAWVAAAEGAVSEAVALAGQAAEVAAAQTQSAVEVFARHTAVCFGDCRQAQRLAELANKVDGPRAPAAAEHAAALAAADGDALQAVSGRLEEMGALLLAADAAAQAAAAYAGRGRRGCAQIAAARARRLAEACEGARTPALATLGAPPQLTAREREIVTMAADGLSNRQIAERLTVSVRTVEGHLYRACAKLDTSNRADLAALLRGN